MTTGKKCIKDIPKIYVKCKNASALTCMLTLI